MVFIRHLNGTVLASFVRPAVLITDAYNALNNQPYRRGEKGNEFGGTVFLYDFATFHPPLGPLIFLF